MIYQMWQIKVITMNFANLIANINIFFYTKNYVHPISILPSKGTNILSSLNKRQCWRGSFPDLPWPPPLRFDSPPCVACDFQRRRKALGENVRGDVSRVDVWWQRQGGLRRCKHVKGFVFVFLGEGSRKRIVYVKSLYLLLEVLFNRCVHANVDER